MDTHPIWMDAGHKPEFPGVTSGLAVDVAIVGAGITGITAAFLLHRAGLKVAVFEAREVAGGTTGYSTGNLYEPTQARYSAIGKKFGTQAAGTVAQSRRAALDWIEQLVHAERLDCHFSRRTDYFFASDASGVGTVETEVAAMQDAGIAADFVEQFPFPAASLRTARLERQARLNPYLYVTRLAEILAAEGCAIFTSSKVTHHEEKDGACRLTVNGHAVTAGHLIVATHMPIGVHSAQFHAFPYRSYVVAARLKSAPYPDGRFHDTGGSGYITSTHAVHGDELDTLMVAGEHHKTGQSAEDTHAYYRKIEDYIRERFEVDAITHRWSAQHYQVDDALPIIGRLKRNSKRSYIATGYFADGLVFGTIAATILSDLVQGLHNPWAATYDALRSNPVASAGKYLRENLNMVGEYLKDLPQKVEASHFGEIAPGEAKRLMVDGEKLAAYRDEQGELHVVSAICTHMKCVVSWNAAERSWDCPCHGSRFSCDGGVMEGPAMLDLARKSVAEGR